MKDWLKTRKKKRKIEIHARKAAKEKRHTQETRGNTPKSWPGKRIPLVDQLDWSFPMDSLQFLQFVTSPLHKTRDRLSRQDVREIGKKVSDPVSLPGCPLLPILHSTCKDRITCFSMPFGSKSSFSFKLLLSSCLRWVFRVSFTLPAPFLFTNKIDISLNGSTF